MSFTDLNLIKPILTALKQEGYTHPTPIQSQAIPHALQERDILGCAQTGTGKTAAFILPILQLLHAKESKTNGVKTLILTPTRELAIQINDSISSYSHFMTIRHAVIYGGVSQKSQVEALKRGLDILVATPGRLLDLMNQGYVNLNQLDTFVLDEADRMLDMGFIHDVKKVIKKLPSKRQTLFFSATMPKEIQQLANQLLKNPVKIEVTPPASTVDRIDQSVYHTNKGDKNKLLLHLLDDESIDTALVFTKTKHGANKVVKFLSKENVSSAAIHGNKSQTARQNALKDFKNGQLRVLVATDIAARGIDIDDLCHVFNMDLPNVPETYVHRIGRTGRAGNSGTAIAFCSPEEVSLLKTIQKLTGQVIPVINEHPFPSSSTAASSEKNSNSNRKPGGYSRKRKVYKSTAN